MMKMRPEFAVHMLNEQGKERARLIAWSFTNLLDNLEVYLGPAGAGGRFGAITRTKLEEACFFAKKAMASCPENQEQP